MTPIEIDSHETPPLFQQIFHPGSQRYPSGFRRRQTGDGQDFDRSSAGLGRIPSGHNQGLLQGRSPGYAGGHA